MNMSPNSALIAALRGMDSCSLANAIESFGSRLRNEGFADGSIRCQFPAMTPMVGHAVTIKIRGANPPTGSSTYLESTDWWDYVLSVPAPRVVVVEDVSSKPGLGAFLGEVHANILKALGCVGAVTNGSVRDISAVERLGFQFFSGSLSVSHSYVHIVETGTSVTVAGLAVTSGTLIHGDRNGVQSVPAELMSQIPTAAAAIAANERRVIEECQSPGVSIGRLRAIVARNRG